MHLLLLVSLTAIPSESLNRWPDIALPADLKLDISHGGFITLAGDYKWEINPAISDTVRKWLAENPSRMDPKDIAKPPPQTGRNAAFEEPWVFGRFDLNGHTAVVWGLRQEYGVKGDISDQDTRGFKLHIATLAKNGTVIDAAKIGEYWEMGHGAQARRFGIYDAALSADAVITTTARHTDRPPATLKLLPSGLICPADVKPAPVGTFEDPKSKERLTLTNECNGRLSVVYRNKPDGKEQWMVVASSLAGKPLKTQFAASPKIYTVELAADGKSVKCTNPDKTVQKFELLAP